MTKPNGIHDGDLCRVLTLDGGGAKGFYTLGVLREIEAMVGHQLCETFTLVFGTSTGAIIAALVALGKTVEDIHAVYRQHVPTIMRAGSSDAKSKALEQVANTVFADADFDDLRTGLGIVAARWDFEKPMIFKGSVGQAHGRRATFVPGFSFSISEAVQASCSAYPFFDRKVLTTESGDRIELVDGGYCANNPTLYAIADCVKALNKKYQDLRVVSVGVGIYPEPKRFGWPWVVRQLKSVQLLQKTLNINTLSMDQLRTVLFQDVPTLRINETFEQPEMATDLMEHNLEKLNMLYQRGRESFAKNETTLRAFLL